jgi:hypothetical protein
MDTLSSNISISTEFFLAVISGLVSLVVAWLTLKSGRLLCLVSKISAPVAKDASPMQKTAAQSCKWVRIEVVNYGSADIRHKDIQENIRLSPGEGHAFAGSAVLVAKTSGMDCQVNYDGGTIEIDPGHLFKSGDCMRLEVPLAGEHDAQSIVSTLQGTARIYNVGRLRILTDLKKETIMRLYAIAVTAFVILIWLLCEFDLGPFFYFLCLTCSPLCAEMAIALVLFSRVNRARKALVPTAITP